MVVTLRDSRCRVLRVRGICDHGVLGLRLVGLGLTGG